MIKKLQRSLCLAGVLLFVMLASAFAQKQVVTGKVTDGTGAGMPGVNVLRKGTTTGTTTDTDGAFSIEAAPTDILVVSFIGYKSQELTVGSQTSFTVALEEDLKTLEEVVVVGYGEMRKADLTSAQSSITSADMNRTVNTTIEQAMQGRAAGVLVTQNTGAPGGGISVTIRGINSINGSNEPLYVVDGVQIQGGNSASGVNPLAGLNPADIEGMEILQGPSATAIYGSRGTNGVVLITTKRGKGPMKISYGYTYSVQTAPETLNTMNLSQYAQMENEYKTLVGGEIREDFADPSILGEGTNWQNELFNSAAMQKHQLSISGGTTEISYYLSGERLMQEGVAVGSGFDRSSVRLNMDSKPNKWLTIGATLNYAQTDEQLASNNVSGSNLIVNAIQLAPQIPVRNIDGSFGGGDVTNGSSAEQFSPVNPIALADVATNYLGRRNLLAGLNAGIKIIDGLVLSSNFNTNVQFSNGTYFIPTFKFGYQENTSAFLEEYANLNTYWGWSQTLQYTKQINKHHINAMVTHEAQESTWKNLKGSRTGFLTNAIVDLNAGNLDKVGNSGGQGSWAQESYLARVNYNFSDRYIVTAAIRADGSVNFGPGNKWGYFPSISAAWRISEEAFFEPVEFVSDFRLRYETGVTGNQGSPGPIYGTLSKALATEWGAAFRPARYENINYAWEETSTNNFGITLGLFNNRITLDADYYIKKTDNLILPAELPWYMGSRGDNGPAVPVINVGSLENKGYGISINTINIDDRGFKWTSNLNISGFKTEVTALTTGSNHITKEAPDWFLANFAERTQVGYAPWLFFGYIEEGIFQTEEEVQNSARPVDNNGNPRAVGVNSIWVGDIKYKDINIDGKIDASDRTFLGNPYPKFFGGFTNNFSYKGFDISVLITYSYGNDVFNYLRYQNANPNNINLGRNMFTEAFNYAKLGVDEGGKAYVTNPETNVNRLSSSNLNGNYDRLTDKYLEDGSYLRVKNISVNYNIPTAIFGGQKFIKSMRVGASAQNVFTITGYSGYDPEIGSYVGPNAAQAQGFIAVDYGRYPITPVYTFNVGIDF